MKLLLCCSPLIFTTMIFACGGGGGDSPISPNALGLSNGQSQTDSTPTIVTTIRTNYGHPDFHYPVDWYNSNYHPEAFHVDEYVDTDPRPLALESTVRDIGYELHEEMSVFAADVLRQMNQIYFAVINGQVTSDDPVIAALDQQFALDVEQCISERGLTGEIITYEDCRVLDLAYRVPSGGVILVKPSGNVESIHGTSIALGAFTVERPQGWFGHGARYQLRFGQSREFVSTSTTYPFDSVGGSIDLDELPTDEEDESLQIGQAELNQTAYLFSKVISTLRGMRTGIF